MSHHTPLSPQVVCTHCGTALAPGARFCSRCGQPYTPPPSFELVLEHGQSPAHFPLPLATVLIGRAEESLIPITDSAVSRHHVRLTWDGVTFIAEDIGSRGGTRLNGVLLQGPARLKSGDRLALSDHVVLRLSGGVSAANQETVLPGVPTARALPQSPRALPQAPPQSPRALPHVPQVPQARPSTTPWPMILVVLGVLLLGGSGAGFWFFGGSWRDRLIGEFRRTPVATTPGANTRTPAAGTPVPGETTQPPTVAPSVPTPLPLSFAVAPGPPVPVPADGKPHADSQGVSLSASAELLDSSGGLQMVSGQGQGSLAEALNQIFSVETGYYAVTAAQDGRGHADLTFPARTQDSRVAVVIDDTYVTVLDVPPKDGKLHVKGFIGPQQIPDPPPFGVARGGSRHYMVIGPAAGGISPGSNMLARLLAPPVASAEGPYRSCFGYPAPRPGGYSTVPITEYCRTNAPGTIHVTWSSAIAFPEESADNVVRALEGLMQSYNAKKFSAANLQPSAPMIVVIDATINAPQYNPKNGVIYLPPDTATSAQGAGRLELAHELFHWIEDEEYLATIAALSGPKSWWLEMAAENGVFLIDNTALDNNLTKYGQVAARDNVVLGLQVAPYAWAWSEEARYVQAQLVKVNMCDSEACAISEAGFVAAINAGTYPFDSDDARTRLSRNLDDYARYLIGSAPERANTAIPLGAAVSNGGSYGDTIHVSRTSRREFDISSSSYPPQTAEVAGKNGPVGFTIKAAIEADGVYPLRVSNGAAAPNASGPRGPAPSWPVMLKIEPGTELFYRLGNGPPVYHNGKSELTLGPIHDKIGHPLVRVVAFARGKAGVINAKVEVIDLRGDWVLLPGQIRSNSVQCISTNPDSSSSDPTEFPKFATYLSAAMAPKGSYVIKEANELEFQLDPGMTLSDDPDDRSELEAIGLIGPDNIQGQLRFYAPKPEGGMYASTLALTVLPVGLVAWRVRRRAIRIAAVLMIGLLLAGCIGITMYGTIDTRYILDKAEYIGKGDKQGEPLWRISRGTGTSTIDFTIEVEVAPVNEDDKPTKDTMKCTGSMQYDMVVEIYKDGVIKPDEGG